MAELLLDHLSHLLEGDGGRRVTQPRQLALELLPVFLGDEPDVEERHDLAELHRRALHMPERLDDLLRRLDMATLERRLPAVLAAGYVADVGARLPDCLTSSKTPDSGGTPPA